MPVSVVAGEDGLRVETPPAPRPATSRRARVPRGDHMTPALDLGAKPPPYEEYPPKPGPGARSTARGRRDERVHPRRGGDLPALVRTIRSEADLDGLEPVLERTVVRMIHASGMVDLAADVAASPGFGPAAAAALRAGAPILCDTSMVAAGVTRARLPAANDVALHADRPARRAARRGARHDPHRGRARALARAPGWLARRRRQRAHGAVPAARDPRGGRRRHRPGRGHRRPGRVHRRGRVEGRARRASRRRRVPRRPRPPRRQRDRRGRRQRARERGRMTAVRRRARAPRRRVPRRSASGRRRPRAADAQGAARHRVGARRRVPERAPRAQRRAADRLARTCARTSSRSRSCTRSRPR